MVLVDTSVFIGYFKEVDESPYRKMRYLVDNCIPYGICNHVYQELLQGALDEKEWRLLRNYLGSLPFFDLTRGKQSYESAARLYFDCRRRGITIRSSIDLLIAEIAIENDLYLLHDDRDYVSIASVCKKLKFY